ncbi:MAG: ABC transporter permease, partial [Sporichthyaceae bacterium]
KTLAVLAVETLQVVLICDLALALGWQPTGSALAVLPLLLTGTATFCAFGLLMAGSLRAEATLAFANLIYLLLLVTGGIAVPLDRFPSGVRTVLELLPAGALAEGLRDVLRNGAGMPWSHLGVLVAWAVAAGAAAAASFRWE